MKYILPSIILVISLIFGFYIQYFNKDLSKNTGFIFSSYKFTMPLIHIFVGILIGFLIYPKYDVELENSSIPEDMNWKVWSRQITGIVLYLAFTIRNIIKHPSNLKNNMKNCGMEEDYSFMLSSVTRQQGQLVVGICISYLIADSFTKNETKITDRSSYIFNIIISISLIEYIIHFISTRKDYTSIKNNLLKCLRSPNQHVEE
jgi:hypothetical protein